MENKQRALRARRKVLQMIHRAGTSHIASNFSVIDIATVLYGMLAKDDVVVWSKGWAAATIYYFLAERGEISKKDLEKFPNPPYLGLAETSVKGVLCNGGSVGHGPSIAVGIALGYKRSDKKGMVYCIMSDGELNEGSVWEAVMLAKQHKLDNLVFIIDANKWQAMGKTRDIIDLSPIGERFRGFGWSSTTIDGHSYAELRGAIHLAQIIRGVNTIRLRSPKVIVCNTIKGKGVSFMENHLLYHYKNVDKGCYLKALRELV